MNRSAEALEAAERALELEPDSALTLDTIGVAMSRAGAYQAAVRVLARAIEAAPSEPQFRFNLASACLFLGDFEQAEASYEAAISLRPAFYRAHWALSDMVKATPERNHIDRLQAALAETHNDVDSTLYLCHALAKEHEDLGHFETSLEYLVRGNAPKRASIRYSSDRDRALFDSIEKLFTESLFARAPAGDPNAEPIFVVGMPRTGTTLVERILSSHSDVYSAGELQDFGLALKRASQSRSNRILDTETIEKGIDTDLAEVGQRYIAGTRPATGREPRFVDKMPMNFLYIGFIHLALPNARIVCLRRNPLDTCVSNFRQLYRLDESYYGYACDLGDIARYYIQFDRLMAHWDKVLPGMVLQIQYEELVRDQERQTRRLLEHCELGWQEACLKFHENQAPIATASAVQARQPLYSDSIGRWRRYGSSLDPIRQQLEEAGIDCDRYG